MAATSEQQITAFIILYGPVVVGGLAVIARTIYVLIRRVADKRHYPWPKVTWLYHIAFAVQGLAMAGAFLLFSSALHEPAARSQNILGGGTQVMQGWAALVMGFPFWGMNAWLILAPIFLLLIGIFKDAILQLVVLTVQIVLCVVIWKNLWQDNFDLPGFRHWFAAYCLIATAYAIPTSYGRSIIQFCTNRVQRERLRRYKTR